MEKEKMIEEMTENGLCCIACEMCDETLENGKFIKAECLESGHTNNCSISKHVAEAFIDAGYRKVHEGSVVLTGIDKGTMYAKVTEGSVVLTKEELESGITFNEVVKSIVRKETAKEYHDKMDREIEMQDFETSYEYEGMKKANDEVLKEMGIEVEE